jgi:hypothetical protein
MRKWLLIAVGVGLAAAQEPAKAPKAEEKADQEKKPAPEPPKKFEALDRALRKSWQAKTPAPQGPCAIPLLNAAPGATTVNPDPMIIVPKGAVPDKNQVQVPAPSCDDVKKDAEKK